jgi:hypothetical protein
LANETKKSDKTVAEETELASTQGPAYRVQVPVIMLKLMQQIYRNLL